MVDERSWKEFRDSGLFWFVNQTLHVFGWSLVADIEVEPDGKQTIHRVYPARVKFRGFTEEVNTEGYKKVSKYLKDNIDELEKESKE